MDNRKSSTPTVTADVATVFVAIELSGKDWLTAVQSPRQERPGRHKLAAAFGKRVSILPNNARCSTSAATTTGSWP
jgi:hypothetical protein